MDIARAKRRLMVMLAIDTLCALVAAGAMVVAVRFQVASLYWLFAAALIVGFAAQIWFIAGFRAATKGA